MKWTVETLNDAVDAEMEALPADMRARFSHIAFLIEEFGLERVREPHVKHLRGPLWEMRMKGKDGISRAIYVTATGRRVGMYPANSTKGDVSSPERRASCVANATAKNRSSQS